jgi:uncharacterized protein DUF4145
MSDPQPANTTDPAGSTTVTTPLSVSRKLARRIMAKEQELSDVLPGTDYEQTIKKDLQLLHAQALLPPTERVYCNECGGLRNHQVISAHKSKIWRDDPIQHFLQETGDVLPHLIDATEDSDERHECTVCFEILRCKGCDCETVRRIEYWKMLEDAFEDILREQIGDQEYEALFQITRYPPPMARRAPGWIALLARAERNIPNGVTELVREIYQALQSGSRRLVVMGVRSVLEAVIFDKTNRDERNFKKNLNNFQQAGYLSTHQEKNVYEIIKAGNASTHRGWTPTDDEVTTLLDITESVIESTYLHQSRVEQLEIPQGDPA